MREWGRKASYALIVVFGSSTWLGVNAVWLELPLLVNALPESWNLPSFLSVIVQLACVGPIAYSIWEKCHGWLIGHRQWIISGFIAFGAVCLFLLALLWPQTGYVAGADRSVALFVLFFFTSIVCCTSNVLFLPFMGSFRLRPELMTAFFMGMGISAFIPSTLSLIQGAGSSECVNGTSGWEERSVAPAFHVSTFFAIITGWMTLTLIGFLVLLWGSPQTRPPPLHPQLPPEEGTDLTEETPVTLVKVKLSYSDENITRDDEITDARLRNVGEMGMGEYVGILVLVVWVNALMNGFLPSIQSFACLPYGQTTYHLAVVFANIANPIACFIPQFVRLRGNVMVTLVILTGVATALAAYIVALAALSPRPLLQDTLAGSILCVGAMGVELGVLAYLRTAMAGRLRSASGSSEGRLFWYGAMTQAGSFAGSIVAFLLVNLPGLHVFTPAQPQCP